MRTEEYVSLFADSARCLRGRTPIECYRDFIAAFTSSMGDMMGNVIVDVVVGMGPCGELRYPSYQEQQGWRFPGVRSAPRCLLLCALCGFCEFESSVHVWTQLS